MPGKLAHGYVGVKGRWPSPIGKSAIRQIGKSTGAGPGFDCLTEP